MEQEPLASIGRWRGDRGPGKGHLGGAYSGPFCLLPEEVQCWHWEEPRIVLKCLVLGERGAEGSTKLFDQSLAPGKEISVFFLAAAAKGAIIRRWHFALKLFPPASDIFLFLLVRRPFSATDSNDSGVRISFPLGEKPVQSPWGGRTD